MSKKGEAKKVKALNAPKSVRISRKEETWTIKTSSGPHKREDSVALAICLRNFAKIAQNVKEVKQMLNKGAVLVNGVKRKDPNFPVGLFDFISIPEQKLYFRVLFDKKRRIILKELENDDTKKIVKVVGKKMTKKGVQINTDDSRVIMNDKSNVGDSLVFDFNKNTVEKVLELKVGALVYITKGAHCANKGTVKEITPASARREKLVRVEIEGKEYETVSRNIIVIGDKKEEINI
jgi:small subunit ribosomal protein S4e